MSKLLPFQLNCDGKPVARLYGLSNALMDFVLFCKHHPTSVVELWHGIRLVDASYNYDNWKDDSELLSLGFKWK